MTATRSRHLPRERGGGGGWRVGVHTFDPITHDSPLGEAQTGSGSKAAELSSN